MEPDKPLSFVVFFSHCLCRDAEFPNPPVLSLHATHSCGQRHYVFGLSVRSSHSCDAISQEHLDRIHLRFASNIHLD